MKKLQFEFYNRNVVEVAKELLGKKLNFGEFSGIITEVEAYRGFDDEASHAYKGPTKRSSIMFDNPGFTYIYLIYGVYYCLNIVTEEKGSPSAVLIRGIRLPGINLDGPGKICRYLGLNNAHNGINVVTSNELYLTEGVKIEGFLATPRIGITKATDKKWRFVMI